MLETVLSINDLGIIFDAKMSFNLHIQFVVGIARVCLGFTKRWSKEFEDPYVTKAQFMALVGAILEYASVFQSSSYSIVIESVQLGSQTAETDCFSFIYHLERGGD